MKKRLWLWVSESVIELKSYIVNSSNFCIMTKIKQFYSVFSVDNQSPLNGKDVSSNSKCLLLLEFWLVARSGDEVDVQNILHQLHQELGKKASNFEETEKLT